MTDTAVQLEPGDTAPSFDLLDDNLDTVSLSDFAGRRLLVYFYPAALTSGCTLQARDYRDSHADLDAAGVAVVGISRDEPARLAEFRAAEQLNFPLLSDPDARVHRAYGVWGEKVVNGQAKMGVLRSLFVIGADGIIEQAYYSVAPEGGPAEVLAAIGRKV